ncbi:hypothetical protein MXB_4405, partial [Myxobolus squamalis]
ELLKILCSGKEDDFLRETLFNFLRIGKLEVVCELISKRSEIIEQMCDITSIRKSYLEYGMKSIKRAQICKIQISNDLLLNENKKFIKKLCEKFSKVCKNYDWILLDHLSEETSIFVTAPRAIEGNKCIKDLVVPLKFPHVFDLNMIDSTYLNVGKEILNIPLNSLHIKELTYDEIVIFPLNKDRQTTSWPLIQISETDELTQQVFKDVDQLNQVQSIIYKHAINSCENLLICAPTGAGKTYIALLTVLRELKLCFNEKKIKINEIKVVYIAPMKALASEITQKFIKSLSFLNLNIKQVTGDTRISNHKISMCNIIVTTPEKWDILTRKSNSKASYTLLTRLLIIDEIHLLQNVRGSVIESIVARARCFIESKKISLRIIGLSATLPNYIDVAIFLNVNPYTGLYFFDSRFRPVPLEQCFIGIKMKTNSHKTLKQMDLVCFQKMVHFLKDGHQVIVFVHGRDLTRTTALEFRDYLKNYDLSDLVGVSEPNIFSKNKTENFQNAALRHLADFNISIHHAGLSKQDRYIVENLFLNGNIRVLISTSTLAWGVNLPARAVIIKGTSIYDSSVRKFRNIGIIDIQQMFGRAGRPQFDSHGCGVLITESGQLKHYVEMLFDNLPIESKLMENLEDALNAEISLGTVTTIQEGVKWLSYTFLYQRLFKNPVVYGLTNRDIERFNENVKRDLTDLEVFRLLSMSSEFEHFKNIGRIMQAYYEICVYNDYPLASNKFFTFVKAFNRKMWPCKHTGIPIFLTFTTIFSWNSTLIGFGLDLWIFCVENTETYNIYHHSQISINYKKNKSKETITEIFIIPIYEPLPSQHIIKAVSACFLGAESEFLID